jgi:hypothetical protein
LADGSRRKSDTPVGTGRDLKPRGRKAAARGRSEYPSGLVSYALSIAYDFSSAFLLLHFFGHIPSCQSEAERLQNKHANRCTCGVSEEPNCLMENLK